MSKIKCPICETEIEEGMKCPKCSFESHYSFSVSNLFVKNEQERINKHIEWWKALEQEIETLKQKVGKKPTAFMITEQKTVYCLFEGLNTFGSTKTNSDCEQHQKLILPGVTIRPVYFSIIITSDEHRKKCVINELEAESTTLFVNSTTNPVISDTVLSDGDEIIISIGKDECRIKFRININK